MKPMCQIMFYNQLPTSDTIHKGSLAPEVGRFHIGVLADVEPGHWGRHQVSGHDTGADTKCPDMKEMCKIRFYIQLPPSDTIHKWTLAPQVGRFQNGV